MNNYNLTIDEYFSLVQQKIRDNDFTILEFSKKPENEISVYLESVNYVMYEYSKTHEDNRQIFPYIIEPNGIDWDFSSLNLKNFIHFLAKNKSKTTENLKLKIKNDIKLSFFVYEEYINIKYFNIYDK